MKLVCYNNHLKELRQVESCNEPVLKAFIFQSQYRSCQEDRLFQAMKTLPF